MVGVADERSGGRGEDRLSPSGWTFLPVCLGALPLLQVAFRLVAGSWPGGSLSGRESELHFAPQLRLLWRAGIRVRGLSATWVRACLHSLCRVALWACFRLGPLRVFGRWLASAPTLRLGPGPEAPEGGGAYGSGLGTG